MELILDRGVIVLQTRTYQICVWGERIVKGLTVMLLILPQIEHMDHVVELHIKQVRTVMGGTQTVV